MAEKEEQQMLLSYETMRRHRLRLLATKCKKLGKPDFGLAYDHKIKDLNDKIRRITWDMEILAREIKKGKRRDASWVGIRIKKRALDKIYRRNNARVEQTR